MNTTKMKNILSSKVLPKVTKSTPELYPQRIGLTHNKKT